MSTPRTISDHTALVLNAVRDSGIAPRHIVVDGAQAFGGVERFAYMIHGNAPPDVVYINEIPIVLPRDPDFHEKYNRKQVYFH